ncbi:hypothetical protein ACVJGC_001028 [Bradyrhizobium diazoefficiens]
MQRERQRQDHRIGPIVRHDGGHDLLQKIWAARHLRRGVDRIARRREGHQLKNLALRFLSKLRQCQPDRLRGVREQHTETARRREDCQARPLRQAVRQQDRCSVAEIDEFVDAADAHRTATGKQRVEHRVRSCHRPGVRSRGGLTCR